jgi:uncharacterized protein YbcI
MPEQQGTAQEPSRGDQLVAIAGDVAAIVKQAWGRGPARTTAHWAGSDALVVLMDNGQTDAERTLRDARHADEVLRGRRMLHEAVEARLSESVTRHTGRRVRAMLSATHLEPDVSVEVFLLGYTASDASEDPPAAAPENLLDRAHAAAAHSRELHDDTAAVRAKSQQASVRRRRRLGGER